MSNKIIFNFDDLFISVGIDVGASSKSILLILPTLLLADINKNMLRLVLNISIKKVLTKNNL